MHIFHTMRNLFYKLYKILFQNIISRKGRHGHCNAAAGFLHSRRSVTSMYYLSYACRSKPATSATNGELMRS